LGSASELEYHLLLAKDLGFVRGEDESLIEEPIEVKKMLTRFIQYVNTQAAHA
jgi:four helix bundle protein